MKKGLEIVLETRDLKIYHQNFPKKQVKLHSHKDCHLFIPIRGSFTVTANDFLYQLKESQMLFLPANINHSFDSSDKNGERLIVQFSPNKNLIWSKTPIKLNTSQLIKELIFQMLLKNGNDSFISVSIAFQNILSELTQQDVNPLKLKLSNAKDNRLVQFLEILEEKPELPLNDITKGSGLSARTLLRLCQDEINSTPKELQIYFRMEKAKSLLTLGMPVTQVTYETGYNSLSTFIQNFRDSTGELPSDFKKY